jgi:glutamate/tyrosine decarboxylase-like PLP-dependent enzyme
MMLRHLGLDGYRELIAHDLQLAATLAEGVRQSPDLELLAHGLSVVCFRCRPPGIADAGRLDDVNRQVLSRVQLSGRAFVAGTTIDGVFAPRACVINPGSGPEDIALLLRDLRTALGEALAGLPAPEPLSRSATRSPGERR